MRKQARMLFAVAVAVALVATVATGAMAKRVFDREPTKMSALAYHDEWRVLWEDHITWTRIVIIGILDGLDSASVQNYTGRLLQNPGDMARALKPFYGQEQAGSFGDLVTQHLVQAAGILEGIKNGQNISDALTAWYQNAHDIAVLMSKLNPKNWNLVSADRMWKEHLDATVNETLANFGHNWPAEVAAYNMIVSLAVHMADFTSMGIMKQFPMMFSGVSLAVSNN